MTRAADNGATCARCGQPCEAGPWREQLCNACALELGRREVEERQRAGREAQP